MNILDVGSIPTASTKIMRRLLIIIFLLIIVIPISAHSSDVVIHNLQTIKLMKNQPIRMGLWKYTPTVVICEHAPVKYTSIKKAVEWWKERGHVFYHTIYKKDYLEVCKRSNPEGYIVVELASREVFKGKDSAEAITHFFVENNTNQVLWAKIYLRNIPIERILEHEMGHALGFLHIDKPGHIMNEVWVDGGWDDDGLRVR